MDNEAPLATPSDIRIYPTHAGTRRRTGTDFSFDAVAAERVDLITMAVVFGYLLLYSLGFCCLYRVYRARRSSGAWRTWNEGPEQRNRWPVGVQNLFCRSTTTR